MKELWKDISGYNGDYEVSTKGRVRSNKCSASKLLTLSPHKDGYLKVGLSKNKKLRSFTVHKLVMLSFVGNSDLPIDHINKIKTDNNLSNLRYLDHRENVSRSKKNCKSKYTGVSLHKKTNKWRSRIYINKTAYCLGYFKEEINAHEAYQSALNNWINNKTLPI